MEVTADKAENRAPVRLLMASGAVGGQDRVAQIGITEQNPSLLKSGKVKGVRFETLARLCDALACQPGELSEAASTDD